MSRFLLAALSFSLLTGCHYFRSADPVSEQVMDDTPLPPKVATGDNYQALLTFRKREIRRIENYRKRLGDIQQTYDRMVEAMYPDGIPMPEPAVDGSTPEDPPMPELPPELQAEWERLQRLIHWRYKRIEKAFSHYTEIHPEDWSAMNELGEFLQDHGLVHRAAAWWEKAVRIAPDQPELHNNIGVYYSHTGDPLKAVDAFRRAIALKDSVADYHFNLATLYFTARDDVGKREGWDLPTIFWKCQAEYERARELDPENFNLAKACFENYIMAHFFGLTPADYREKEMQAVDRCLSMDLTDSQRVQVLTHKGRLHRKYQEYDKAEEALSAAVEAGYGDAPMATRLLHKVRRDKQKNP